MERNDARPTTGGVRFKTGIVADVDVDAGAVTVSFEDVGIVSHWLTVCYPKSGQDKAYWLPDVGDQVRCLMDEYLEDGAVLGSIYSSADAVPWASGDKIGWQFRDGGGFSYDRSTGELDVTAMGVANISVKGNAQISVGGTTTIHSDGTATIDAGQTVVTGSLLVKGPTMLAGGVGGEAGAGTPIPGNVVAQDDVIAGDISLTKHPHTDSMEGRTTPPLAL